jgi:hypothetical protein
MADAIANVLAGDPRFKALADLSDRLGSLDKAALLVYLVDLVTPEALPHLAEQFHVMGLEGWAAADTEDARRQLIKQSIELHRHKGTPWAMKRALAPLGLEVELIDRQAQRAAFAALSPHYLDGSWRLNGAVAIRPLGDLLGMPQIQHWAEFIVRTNLAEVHQPGALALLKALVDEWKPARSRPLFVYWLAFVIQLLIRMESEAVLTKEVAMRYPWPGRVVSSEPDARWRLGRDGETVRLPQPFGTFALGELRGGKPGWRLRAERVLSEALMQAYSITTVYGPPRLAQRHLDGTWRLSCAAASAAGETRLQKSAELVMASELTSVVHEQGETAPPRLSGQHRLVPWMRLNGGWTLGGTRSVGLRFGQRLGRNNPIDVESMSTLQVHGETYASPERLTRPAIIRLGRWPRRLDGSWHLGAEQRLGHFHLDGRPLRAPRLSWANRLGRFALMRTTASGGPQVTPRRLPLDGSWRLGGPAAPESEIRIIKEAP